MKTSKVCAIVAPVLMGLLSGELSAITVFEFGNSSGIVTGDQPLRLSDGITDFTSGSSRFFSTENMHPGSGYAGSAFHGGFRPDGGGTAQLSIAQVSNDVAAAGGLDALQFHSGSGSPFLSVLVMSTISPTDFGGDSEITVGASLSATISDAGNARLVIKKAGSYYISDNNLGIGTTYAESSFLFSSTTWSAYNPSAKLYYSGSTVPTPSMEGVDGVGVAFYRSWSAAVNDSEKDLYVGHIAITAVPEPSEMTLASCSVISMFLFLMGRTRMRKWV